MQTTDELVRELDPIHISSIRVGRKRPGVGTLQAVLERKRELDENPLYWARSSHLSKSVTLHELRQLVDLGATEESEVQRIDVFKTDRGGPQLAVPCARCHCLINCGTEPSEGACVCGQKFVVTFDGAPDWSLPRGPRCLHCGQELGFRETLPGRPPNVRIPKTPHQTACNACEHSGVGRTWTRESLRAPG